MRVVNFESEPTFTPEKPEELFKANYLIGSTNIINPWDISPDGRRFLMIKQGVTSQDESTEETPRPKIIVVLNWFEELKERVPVA